MLMGFWSEISVLIYVFGVDYFKAKKCVFYKSNGNEEVLYIPKTRG